MAQFAFEGMLLQRRLAQTGRVAMITLSALSLGSVERQVGGREQLVSLTACMGKIATPMLALRLKANPHGEGHGEGLDEALGYEIRSPVSAAVRQNDRKLVAPEAGDRI